MCSFGYPQFAIRCLLLVNYLKEMVVLTCGCLISCVRPSWYRTETSFMDSVTFTLSADFVDGKCNKYDIDFLVSKSDKQLIVVQPIVHSINGEKNPYDLDH